MVDGQQPQATIFIGEGDGNRQDRSLHRGMNVGVDAGRTGGRAGEGRVVKERTVGARKHVKEV